MGLDGSIVLVNVGAAGDINTMKINQPIVGFVVRQKGLDAAGDEDHEDPAVGRPRSERSKPRRMPCGASGPLPGDEPGRYPVQATHITRHSTR